MVSLHMSAKEKFDVYVKRLHQLCTRYLTGDREIEITEENTKMPEKELYGRFFQSLVLDEPSITQKRIYTHPKKFIKKDFALLSVSDKTGIIKFAQELQSIGYDILSTGGTAQILLEEGIEDLTMVSNVTGCPEILNGRVETIHPKIFAGILADRNNAGHVKTLKKRKINNIDIVAVNLYPFAKEKTIENIDIGGVSLLRAGAKNYQSVTTICDPTDYNQVIGQIKNGEVKLSHREHLAKKAFKYTVEYDSEISNWIGR